MLCIKSYNVSYYTLIGTNGPSFKKMLQNSEFQEESSKVWVSKMFYTFLKEIFIKKLIKIQWNKNIKI